MSILFAILIFALAFLGSPVFSLIGAGALYLFSSAGIDSSAVIVEMLRLASLPALIAIPLFTFAGYVLAESGAPHVSAVRPRPPAPVDGIGFRRVRRFIV